MTKKRISSFTKECQIKFDDMIIILHNLGYTQYHSNLQMIDDDIQNKVLEYLTNPTQPSSPDEDTPKEETEITGGVQGDKTVDLIDIEEDIENKISIKGREIKEERRSTKKEAPVDLLLKKTTVKKSKFDISEQAEPTPADPKKVLLRPGMTVKELTETLNVKETEIIKKLFLKGIMATINRQLELETAEMLANEYGFAVQVQKIDTITAEKDQIPESLENETDKLKTRPPIVTIMGHVDHGKTSLLDVIRKTKVTEEEVGGITQKIGAYHVTVNNRSIVFLDTPGHEAFTAMRARGTKVTDIAVLVVAADDGVMPQTKEAISHARAANVPIIVAINKIDKADSNVERVKQQLAENGLVIEEWGGDIISVPISAKKQTGIDELLEMILLVADIADLKANPDRPAEGVIIESRLDRGKGPVATVLIQTGTLYIGDYFVVGNVYGKVKNLLNDRGKHVQTAEPAMPVEVMGLTVVPNAGDIFKVITEKEAKLRVKSKDEDTSSGSTLTWYDKIGLFKELNIILKADLQGSLEAVQQAIAQLATENVQVRIIHSGIGDISEADVLLAKANDAIIIAFNTKEDPNAKKISVNEQVEVRSYNIIFKLLEELDKALKGLLEPETEEVNIGKAQVRAIFRIGKANVIAGCYITEGRIFKNAAIKIQRSEDIVYEGKLCSLKRFKEDVKEVTLGYECGMAFEGFQDVKENDIIEAYVIQKKKMNF